MVTLGVLSSTHQLSVLGYRSIQYCVLSFQNNRGRNSTDGSKNGSDTAVRQERSPCITTAARTAAAKDSQSVKEGTDIDKSTANETADASTAAGGGGGGGGKIVGTGGVYAQKLLCHVTN